jgi:hypothetical protein
MTILTAAEAREHIETSLEDDALERLLDAAEAAIIDRAGPNPTEDTDTATAEERHSPRGDLLMLSRVPGVIVSVTEGTTEVDPEKYAQRPGSAVLRRIGRSWCGPVTVAYIPEGDLAERIRVQIALVKLDLASTPGITSERVGPWTQETATGPAYVAEREALLASLGGSFEGIR